MSRTTSTSKRKTDTDDESSKASPSKNDVETINSSSNESVQKEPSNTKMAAKPSKTKPTQQNSYQRIQSLFIPIKLKFLQLCLHLSRLNQSR